MITTIETAKAAVLDLEARIAESQNVYKDLLTNGTNKELTAHEVAHKELEAIHTRAKARCAALEQKHADTLVVERKAQGNAFKATADDVKVRIEAKLADVVLVVEELAKLDAGLQRDVAEMNAALMSARQCGHPIGWTQFALPNTDKGWTAFKSVAHLNSVTVHA